jgi:hypothetical protein
MIAYGVSVEVPNTIKIKNGEGISLWQ